MKKSLISLLGLIIITNFLAFALAPVASAVIGDIDDEILRQLEPIEDFYNPRGDVTPRSLSEAIAKIIKAVLGLLGIIFLALMVYAGFIWMTAGGSEEKIGQAKKIMSAVIIGLAIVLAAYAVTIFVFDVLIEATATGY